MMRHPLRDLAFTLLLAVISFGGSCVSDSGGSSTGGGYDNGGYNNGSYNGGGYNNGGYNNGGNYGDHRDDNDRPNRIPRFADVVREGTGKLKWTADMDGTIYVYDRDKDEVRYIGPVHQGDDIAVRPDDDRILVANRVVYDQDLKHESCHQLYFASDRRAQNRGPDPVRNAPPPVVTRDAIPDNTQCLTRGGDTLEVGKSPRTGTVYIYDETAGQMLFHTTLKKGASLRVVPNEGAIYTNGQPISHTRFTRGHVVSVYLGAR